MREMKDIFLKMFEMLWNVFVNVGVEQEPLKDITNFSNQKVNHSFNTKEVCLLQ